MIDWMWAARDKEDLQMVPCLDTWMVEALFVELNTSGRAVLGVRSVKKTHSVLDIQEVFT